MAAYNFITPNLCDDMHDSCKPTRNPVKQGGTWLSQNIPAILNSVAYKGGPSLLPEMKPLPATDLGMIVLSPFAKGNGYSNSIHCTHSSTLRTFEEIFGATPLLRCR